MYGAGLCQAQLYRCWQKQNEEGQTTDLEHGPCTFARPAAGVGRTRQLPLEKITLCCPHVYRPRARTVHETLAVAIRMAGKNGQLDRTLLDKCILTDPRIHGSALNNWRAEDY
jgi:hypothetical protein